MDAPEPIGGLSRIRAWSWRPLDAIRRDPPRPSKRKEPKSENAAGNSSTESSEDLDSTTLTIERLGRLHNPEMILHACAKLLAVGLALLLSVLTTHAGTSAGAESPAAHFRFGFSASMFNDINENDAKASARVWAQTLFNERGLAVSSEPVIFSDVPSIAAALAAKRIDAVALGTDEYWQLDKAQRCEPFICALNDGVVTEQYAVLTFKGSGLKGLEDLRGKTLNILNSCRTSLALPWLDTMLLQKGLPCATNFCQTRRTSKLAKAVLPVFFKQTDACLVTVPGFHAMGELNPQVTERLLVLATSPGFIPTGFCFRRDYNDPLKDKIIRELEKINHSPTGAQVLALFQSGSLVARPLASLDDAFALLETHQQLSHHTNQKAAGTESFAVSHDVRPVGEKVAE